MSRGDMVLAGLVVLALSPGASQAPAQSNATAANAIPRVRDYRVAHERGILAELESFVSLPNVAANVEDMRHNAETLVGMMERRGIETRILETGAVPHVFGELNVPGATRTVLFYCHFDGQPVDPSRWVGHRPFKPVYRNGSLQDGAEIVEWAASPERGSVTHRPHSRSSGRAPATPGVQAPRSRPARFG